jgi:hypothetical protein
MYKNGVSLFYDRLFRQILLVFGYKDSEETRNSRKRKKNSYTL